MQSPRPFMYGAGVLLGAFVACLGLPHAASAWGVEGHNYTAHLAVRSLPPGPLRDLFARNEDWFARTSSYPDRWRNRPDNAEAPRHFFDSEHFGHGIDLSQVPRRYADVVKNRNYEQLRTDGIVPWTVGREYKLLVTAMRERRWDDVFVKAAYLSHYAADSHVPFHASENYDGQLSEPSQKGIHSRFETQTLQRSIKLEDLKPGTPVKITNPVAQDFLALQASVDQVPNLLAADRAAAQQSGGDYNDAYWAAFLPKSRPIAIQRLESAGQFLSGLLLAAWNEAGKPTLPAGFVMTDRLLPYAPVFVPRGQAAIPTMPVVTDEQKTAARAAVKTVPIASKILERDVSVNILLPADYETSKKRYPVLYLLHGSAGGYDDWNAKSGIAAYAKGRPLIIVMPDSVGNSWYINSPERGNVEDFYIKELVPAVDKTFRTIAKREGRAIAGISMGGYGAWRLALDNYKLFAAAASVSGALNLGVGDPREPQLYNYVIGLWGNEPDKDTYNREQLLPRVQTLISRRGTKGYVGPALYFDCGADDDFAAPNRLMEQALLERAVPYEFAEFNGSHNWDYWDAHIRDVLQFVERHVTEPAP